MAQKGHCDTNYINIIGHSLGSQSNSSFQTLRSLFIELGFGISEQKVLKPAARGTCQGVDRDTIRLTVSILREKSAAILSKYKRIG